MSTLCACAGHTGGALPSPICWVPAHWGGSFSIQVNLTVDTQGPQL